MLYLGFNVFLFQGDPIGPSKRVRVQWDRMNAGRFRRFLGPGVMRSSVLMLLVGLAGGAILTVFTVVFVTVSAAPGLGSGTELAQIGAFAFYMLGFHVFVSGVGAWLRARTTTPVVARVILLTVLIAVSIGPWIVAAIAGILWTSSGSSNEEALLVGAPSPFFAFVMLGELGSKTPSVNTDTFALAGGVTSLVYAALGLGALFAASRRCKQVLDKHDVVMAEAERMLAEEDAVARRAMDEAARKAAVDERPFADPPRPAEPPAPAAEPTSGEPPSTDPSPT
jgi:hypothetical protein